MTKTTPGRGAKTTANAAAPPPRTWTKTACHRRGTGFLRSDLRNKERAGVIHPPPFAGPNDDDRSGQRTGDDEKESRCRWRTKKRKDRSGWLWQERAVDSATSNYRGQGEYENAVTMLAAMLLREGPVADDARQAGGGQCYDMGKADNSGK